MELSRSFVRGVFATLSLCSSLAMAVEDEAPLAHDPANTWFWGFTLEQYRFDKEAAAKTAVGDSATALGMEAEYYYATNISTTFGMSILMYDDKARFSQTTQNQSTYEINQSSSEARGLPFYADIGYRRFFVGESTKSYLTARLGLSSIFDSSRTIPSCTNCTSEDIKISGGIYGMIGAGMKFGETWGMGIHYKNYFSGDISNVIGLTLTYGY